MSHETIASLESCIDLLTRLYQFYWKLKIATAFRDDGSAAVLSRSKELLDAVGEALEPLTDSPENEESDSIVESIYPRLVRVESALSKLLNASAKTVDFNVAQADTSEFQRLSSVWKQATFFESSPTRIAIHPAYQRIIGMGYPAVPLILEELHNDPDEWFWALNAITGEDPVSPEDRGDVPAMCKAWMHWGRKRGLIA